jgi:hypothetical protein
VRTRLLLPTSIISALLISTGVLTPTTALADTTTTAPVVTTLPLTPPTLQPLANQPSGSYTSLAASMVNYWALQSGQTLSQWTQTNSPQMSSLLGASAQGSTLTDLTNQLTTNGAALQLGGVASFSDLMSSISHGSGTIDGQATQTGMNLAQSLAGLYSASGKKASGDTAIAGLFYDQSLAHLVTSSPNLIGKVSSGFTGQATAAWNAALAHAAGSTSASLSSLPDPCLVGMLNAMGTGSAGGTPGLGGSCGPCDVAGSYLHTSFQSVINPGSNNLLKASSGGVSDSTWSQLQGWLQKGTLAQNPGLAQTQAPSSLSLTSCGASSQAVSGALRTTLPGVFSNLGR